MSELEDWRWLVEETTQAWFQKLAARDADALADLKFLRKQGLSSQRCRLLLEQATLRPLGSRKFERAGSMFFRRQLLEQATGENLARYKAQRYVEAKQVADLCCGLGGDLMALAKVAEATGVDADPVTCLLAAENSRLNSAKVQVVTALAESHKLDPCCWVHIDPDRRAAERRTTNLDYFSPTAQFLEQLVQRHPHCGIKLAPATRLPEHWRPDEIQWLGDRKECKQQIAWFGGTAIHRGARSATAIDQQGNVIFDYLEKAGGGRALAPRLDDFLYEPHPTLIAGRLVDSLANECRLKRLTEDVAYLTGGDHFHPALQRFEVLEKCRADLREVENVL
ncbi:MAG: class I SAM-dependent methyltransferase, partial [Pirellulaceae bacterium]|nr:class I SAM-dependent methyltransferase [Pirellulaceae bacterium]